jgi:hypothetical protein
MQLAVETPVQLQVVAWSDPVIENLGHRPGSAYIEAVWLGILGPTTTFTWMRLARLAAARPSTTIDVVDLAVSLGVPDVGADGGLRRRPPGRSHPGRPAGPTRRPRGTDHEAVVLGPGGPRASPPSPSLILRRGDAGSEDRRRPVRGVEAPQHERLLHSP